MEEPRTCSFSTSEECVGYVYCMQGFDLSPYILATAGPSNSSTSTTSPDPPLLQTYQFFVASDGPCSPITESISVSVQMMERHCRASVLGGIRDDSVNEEKCTVPFPWLSRHPRSLRDSSMLEEHSYPEESLVYRQRSFAMVNMRSNDHDDWVMVEHQTGTNNRSRRVVRVFKWIKLKFQTRFLV